MRQSPDTPGRFTVYNFTVHTDHNYYVQTGTHYTLAHNNCGIEQKAAELLNRAKKHRVQIETPSGRVSVDLAGRAHHEKATGLVVPTPHVKFETRHVGPNGNESYTSGPTREATHADLRMVDQVLRRRGI